jgi:tetratricopeptide (TPR) repeat protein
MTIFARCGAVLLALHFVAAAAFAQVEEAKQAIENGEFVRAVNILSDALASRPGADVYVFLGIAYGNMKEFGKAEEVLKEGGSRFPEDVRFHNELAGVYLATREVEKAKAELHNTLQVDPANSYASDLLATIEISEGEVQTALRAWNAGGRPVIDAILHNYYLNFGSRVIRDALAFRPAAVLTYPQWKTTEARLFQTNSFANVGLEIEPTTVPEHYDAIVRTTSRTNSRSDLLWNLLKGGPFNTSYFDLWNIGNAGVNWNSMYRWDVDRRQLQGRLSLPIGLPGILHLELSDTLRSERWDLSHSLRENFVDRAHRATYRSNAMRLVVKHIPDYRFEIGGGLQYTNRYASGDLPELATDSRNSARLFFETTVRPADGAIYKNRLQLQAFASRKSVLGDFDTTGGTAEFNNRIAVSKDTRTYIDWTIKGGTSRGARPLEEYFMLGLDISPQNLLRGHTAADHGRYGAAPTGTDFLLANLDVDRRIVTVPMFNSLGLPYVVVKGEIFVDAAKAWDRTRIFKNSRLLVDTGAGLRFETPTSSLVLVYGRSLRDGQSVLTGYIERRLW